MLMMIGESEDDDEIPNDDKGSLTYVSFITLKVSYYLTVLERGKKKNLLLKNYFNKDLNDDEMFLN